MATQTQTTPNDANARSLKDDPATSAHETSSPSSIRCPDPSAHTTKSNTLQDQASAAALYITNPARGSNTRDANPLGTDGKLSSASAATSLKHARAQELPSFPVVGIDTQSSAGTAATLAHANKKSPEWWRPEQSAAAGKAALLAHEYKMAPMWEPEASTAGSKAALLAHKDGTKVNLWSPEASSHGNSAANIAMKRQASKPQVAIGQTDDVRKNSLIAATGAASFSGRKRAQSSPAPPPQFPDSANSARNALSAATIAHTPSMRPKKSPTSPLAHDSNRLGSGAMEAARIQHSKSISREMYTEHPPIRMEVEEKQHQDALRASAISMAKKMMTIQQQNADADRSSRSHAHVGATTAHSQQQPLTSEEDLKQQAMRYIGVQEAAQKLAAERLAKIGTDENAAFRSYYGYEKSFRSKLSIRRGRPRASSNPEAADSDDELQSRRIRSQMSQMNKTLEEIDSKRDQDRKHLLAAAERKVQAQMQGLDKKIFDETGKMSPAMIEEWDAKARAKATAASEARMEHHGKIHIGHGKFVDQADIDAVAQARIQPTLDEINMKTEKRRAEDEERRLEQEEQKRQTQKEKERAAELKAEEKRVKDEEKKAARSRTTEEKAAIKQEREAEKEKKKEEKRLEKEEKQKAREAPVASTAAPETAETTTPATAVDESHTAEDDNDDLYTDPTPQVAAQDSEHDSASPASPTSPTSPSKGESKGFKSLLNRFKRRSRHEKPGFIGGASLRASSAHSNRDSAPSSPIVADTTEATGPSNSGRRYSDVSSLSSRGRSSDRLRSENAASGGTEFEEARDEFDEKLAPPPSFTSNDASVAGRKGSPSRDSKFHEIGI
ncbi:hypothetical protein EJ04DRAFT_516662 [Polyplosphaeria fusca]|uniref:Eisosome protein 1 n=1 Tax=Polyplosphaeria fusca TaxID=682080 RepID=A0A9P4UVM6_9PLEO|nr:hypothetical protein EJ04DRAFT_516662 [Polyplosphaeria fusca]